MEYVINVSNLTKSYIGEVILDGINLFFESKKIYGLVGSNGSGKSTLINCMLGIIPWDKGNISLFGKNIRYNKDRKYIFSKCSALLQDVSLPKRLKVLECLELFSAIGNNNKSYGSIVKMLALDEQINKAYNDLSFGQKQKVLIATALLQDFDVLFLDEPTNGLDKDTRSELFGTIKSLKNEGKTIIFVSHRAEEISDICDEIVFVKDQKVIKKIV